MKANLLFLQKFTEQEQDEFDKKKAQSCVEVEAKYQDEMTKRIALFEYKINVEKSDNKGA